MQTQLKTYMGHMDQTSLCQVGYSLDYGPRHSSKPFKFMFKNRSMKKESLGRIWRAMKEMVFSHGEVAY